MIKKAFSIHDTKSGIYNSPFYAHTIGEAERMFKELTLDEKTQVSKHPEDFDLFHVGEYDDNSGTFTSLKSPQHIIKAIQFKAE